MNPNRTQGFTLIELLVVIGIISLLAVAFLPQIVAGRESAEVAADQANLKWHFTTITRYRSDYGGKLPKGTGHKFIIAPWISRKVEHTEQNLQRYFVPAGDERLEELKEIGVDNIWKDAGDLSSLDTSYAGPRAETKRKKIGGKVPLMADDNEFGPLFLDHSLNVLMGDGSVRTLQYDPDLRDAGLDLDENPDDYIQVGRDSRHPLLEQLEK